MVAIERAAQTLRPWLGAAFIAGNVDLLSQLTMAITAFREERDDPADLWQRLDTLLFMRVRDVTGGRMALEMDDGRMIRVRLDDFSVMADELLYLLFEELPQTTANLKGIREFSIKHGSLSALKALYLLYRDLQPAEETETLRRVITSCHAPFRWQGWIG